MEHGAEAGLELSQEGPLIDGRAAGAERAAVQEQVTGDGLAIGAGEHVPDKGARGRVGVRPAQSGPDARRAEVAVEALAEPQAEARLNVVPDGPHPDREVRQRVGLDAVELRDGQAVGPVRQDLDGRLVLELRRPAAVGRVADQVVEPVLHLAPQRRRPDHAERQRQQAAGIVAVVQQPEGRVEIPGIGPVPRVRRIDLRVAGREDGLADVQADPLHAVAPHGAAQPRQRVRNRIGARRVAEPQPARVILVGCALQRRCRVVLDLEGDDAGGVLGRGGEAGRGHQCCRCESNRGVPKHAASWRGVADRVSATCRGLNPLDRAQRAVAVFGDGLSRFCHYPRRPRRGLERLGANCGIGVP